MGKKKDSPFRKKDFVSTTKYKRGNYSPVKAKKYLGQHFLKDETIAQKIAETLSFNGYSNAIEIGPGTGILTKYLLRNNMDLVAMDLDAESIAYMNQNFLLEHIDLLHRKGKFTIIEADFLKCDLSKLFGDAQFAITGNFPYNISTQIVFKMLEMRSKVPEFSGMFQMEVAARICEKEGNKAYGILSVLVQAFYYSEYLFTVSPDVFSPPPKVHSGVLKLRRKENFTLECNEQLFFRVVKSAFNHRRKTLRNSLKSYMLSDILKEDTIFDKRPEQLAVADFIALTKKIEYDSV